MQQQLPLKLPFNNEATFANYVIGQNQQAIAQIKTAIQQANADVFYLWGNDVGLTYLLAACCHEINHCKQTAAYIPLSAYQEFPADILSGLEDMNWICLDDIQAIAGQPDWETALFNLYNQCAQQQVGLIMAATLPPKQLRFNLPDVQSRLSQATIYHLVSLKDDEKISVLKKHADNLGLILPDDVVNYLLTHYSRELKSLIKLLDKINQQSLIAKRRLTIPFVKQLT